MKTQNVFELEFKKNNLKLNRDFNFRFEIIEILAYIICGGMATVIQIPIIIFLNIKLSYLILISSFLVLIIFVMLYKIWYFIFFKSCDSKQNKMKKLNWTELYITEQNNGQDRFNFNINQVKFNKLNIHYCELINLKNKKIIYIKINNSINFNINDSIFKIVFKNINICEKSNLFVLNIELISLYNLDNKIMVPNKNSLALETNKVVNIKMDLLKISEFQSEFSEQKRYPSFWNVKTSKNTINEFNQNIIGQFYFLNFNKLNYLKPYVSKIQQDLSLLNKIIKKILS